jgi:hypothetical protein
MRVQPRCVVAGVLLFCVGAVIAGLVCTRHELSFTGLFDPKYAIIWSGVFGATIAAVISLIGVSAANRSSLDRLDRQHKHDKDESIQQRKHDAEQKDEDRKAAIRREVYTKAVEEAHAVLGSIGGMPERPLSERAKDVDGLQLFLKANSKVWLVAESEAAHLSRELTSLMSELYLKTLQSAYPLRIAMEPVRDLERQAVHAESEIRRIDVRIAEIKEQRDDNKSLEAVIESWKAANDWLKSMKAERDRRIKLLGPDRLKHAKAMFEGMRPVQRIIVRVVSSLRKELHLPADEVQFLEQLADMEDRALAALNRAYGVEADEADGPP